jgi:xanthine dehydrogenase accessory factor
VKHVKRWAETREVMERLADLRAEGKRAAIATVVQVVGSAYRREGAKLLVAEDGSSCGNVSGGCLEEDVREVALRVIATGRSELRGYCSGADDVHAWDLGVGCDGQVDVFVAPAGDAPEPVLDRLGSGEPFAIATLVGPDPSEERRLIVTDRESQGGLGGRTIDRAAIPLARELLDGGNPALHQIRGKNVFIDILHPPPRLVVIGAGEDARPLAALGAMTGFRVVVVDRRAGLLAADRFPERARLVHSDAMSFLEQVPLDADSYVVAMTHSYADDLAFLRVAVRSEAPYIGVLGPRHRTERILGILRGEAPIDENRVHGPVGLDLGGEGAEQVALSILGEILALRSGRRGGSLRDRQLPIHAVAAD